MFPAKLAPRTPDLFYMVFVAIADAREVVSTSFRGVGTRHGGWSTPFPAKLAVPGKGGLTPFPRSDVGGF